MGLIWYMHVGTPAVNNVRGQVGNDLLGSIKNKATQRDTTSDTSYTAATVTKADPLHVCRPFGHLVSTTRHPESPFDVFKVAPARACSKYIQAFHFPCMVEYLQRGTDKLTTESRSVWRRRQVEAFYTHVCPPQPFPVPTA